MPLAVLSINYKNTPDIIRSAFSLDPSAMAFNLKNVSCIKGVEGSLILSTCNRTEIYLWLSSLSSADFVIDWWQNNINLTSYDLKQHINILHEQEAVDHLMRVSCGIESIVIGEPQILGQVKTSYFESKKSKTLGSHLDRLFQKTFAIAKKVRTSTGIGKCPVSMAYSAVDLAYKTMGDFSDKTILVIGSGKTGTLIAKHIMSCKPKKMLIVNRTYDKAVFLAERVGAVAYEFERLPENIIKADVIIVAMATDKFIIYPDMLANIKSEKLFIDLSIPMSIDPECSKINNIKVYRIDNIQQIIENNKEARSNEISEAAKIINNGLEDYLEQEKIISSSYIKMLREHTEKQFDSVLLKNLKRLNGGENPESVLERFAYEMKNKILHNPTVEIKKAIKTNEYELLSCAQKMFGLTLDTN